MLSSLRKGEFTFDTLRQITDNWTRDYAPKHSEGESVNEDFKQA